MIFITRNLFRDDFIIPFINIVIARYLNFKAFSHDTRTRSLCTFHVVTKIGCVKTVLLEKKNDATFIDGHTCEYYYLM